MKTQQYICLEMRSKIKPVHKLGRFSLVFSTMFENMIFSTNTSNLMKKFFIIILKAKYQNGNIWLNFWVLLEVSNMLTAWVISKRKISVPTDHPVGGNNISNSFVGKHSMTSLEGIWPRTIRYWGSLVSFSWCPTP